MSIYNMHRHETWRQDLIALASGRTECSVVPGRDPPPELLRLAECAEALPYPAGVWILEIAEYNRMLLEKDYGKTADDYEEIDCIIRLGYAVGALHSVVSNMELRRWEDD